MARFLTFALVVFLAVIVTNGRPLSGAADGGVAAGAGKKDKEIRIEGKLTDDDPRDKLRNSPIQIHLVKMKAGSVYTIDMVSKEFDSFLRLEDKDGKQLAEDDDSGGDLNARIVFPCRKDGDYKILCIAFAENGRGSYVLTVKNSADSVKYTTAHEVLLGKAGPDFQAEFAVVGQAKKPSDFKGKVVLVAFADFRLEASIAALVRLANLHKSFKTAGLEIMSVTYYNFEFGQKVGFDKVADKLARVDKADKSSEQAALKALAAHHKLEHSLIVLSKEDALKAFDAYAVNGVPQTVLIDRRGVVRLIQVGDTKDAPALEGEIKKLLAEK